MGAAIATERGGPQFIPRPEQWRPGGPPPWDGLDADTIEVIGQIDRYVTVGSRSMVHPFVGILPAPPTGLVPDPAEVEHILMVSASELLSNEAWREEIWSINGNGRAITFFELHGDTVWGATAAMLRQLLTIVASAGLP